MPKPLVTRTAHYHRKSPVSHDAREGGADAQRDGVVGRILGRLPRPVAGGAAEQGCQILMSKICQIIEQNMPKICQIFKVQMYAKLGSSEG